MIKCRLLSMDKIFIPSVSMHFLLLLMMEKDVQLKLWSLKGENVSWKGFKVSWKCTELNIFEGGEKRIKSDVYFKCIHAVNFTAWFRFVLSLSIQAEKRESQSVSMACVFSVSLRDDFELLLPSITGKAKDKDLQVFSRSTFLPLLFVLQSVTFVCW